MDRSAPKIVKSMMNNPQIATRLLAKGPSEVTPFMGNISTVRSTVADAKELMRVRKSIANLRPPIETRIRTFSGPESLGEDACLRMGTTFCCFGMLTA